MKANAEPIAGVILGWAGIRKAWTRPRNSWTRVTADMVSLSRPLVREPGLVARWQSGDRAPSTCVSDNACFVPARRGEGISCLTAVREEKRRQRAAAAEAADGSAE